MNIIFVGYSPRKVSVDFIEEINSRKSFNKFYHFLNIDNFKKRITALSEEECIVFPVYCEDSELKYGKLYLDFSKKVEEICAAKKNIKVFHSSFLGEILGNKRLTNTTLSHFGIRMPEIIDSGCGKMLFINNLSGSGSKTEVSTLPKSLKYNTKYIKSLYKYKGQNYYFCPRALCVGGEINEIYLRFRLASDKNPCVHGIHTPMDADLHNSCYDNLIKPNLNQLKDICRKLGDYMGIGFYAHDFLLENGSNLFYLSESAFKFDNKVWKGMNKSIIDRLTFEIPFGQSLSRSLDLLEEEIKKII